MHVALRLDGGVLWRAVLVSLLGELGDKTFYLIVALAAWCPWQGLRSGGHAPAECCLVFAGASAAFNVRAVLLASAQDSLQWGCWPAALASAALALMGAKAVVERRRACDADLNPFLVPKEPSVECPEAGHGTSWNKSAFCSAPRTVAATAESNPFPAESSQDATAGEAQWNSTAFGLPRTSPEAGAPAASYGAAASLRPLSPHTATVEDRWASLMLAFPVAFALAFLVESGDKSEAALLQESGGGANMAIGAILGFLPAALLATLAGHVLERQLERQTALLLVAFLFLSLGLVSLTQALLHLGVLRLAPVPGGSAPQQL